MQASSAVDSGMWERERKNTGERKTGRAQSGINGENDVFKSENRKGHEVIYNDEIRKS